MTPPRVRLAVISALMKRILPAVVVVLALLGVGAYFFLFKEDTKEAASLGDAPLVSTPKTTAGDEASDGSDGAASETPSADSPDGTWTVITDPNVFGGYRITKTLAGGDTEVTGRTGNVSGSLDIKGDTISKASFEVDMTTLDSGQAIRDGKMKTEGFQSNDFPTATLELTSPLTLKAIPAVGTEFTTSTEADLTLHGVTKAVTVAISARWNGETLDITASAPVLLADFGITPPNVPGASVADNGVLEAQLALTR